MQIKIAQLRGCAALSARGDWSDVIPQPKGSRTMKMLIGGFAAILIGALASPAIAQDQKLAVIKIESVKLPQPAIVEIVVMLENGSKATLLMNVFTAQNLASQLDRIGM
jgi:hypothetical protein